jgi:hypothetical protein
MRTLCPICGRVNSNGLSRPTRYDRIGLNGSCVYGQMSPVGDDCKVPEQKTKRTSPICRIWPPDIRCKTDLHACKINTDRIRSSTRHGHAHIKINNRTTVWHVVALPPNRGNKLPIGCAVPVRGVDSKHDVEIGCGAGDGYAVTRPYPDLTGYGHGEPNGDPCDSGPILDQLNSDLT